MIRLFDIANGKVIPTEHCYTLYFLRSIMKEYPDNYMKIYTYIFYMTCPNPDLNPFFHVPETDKEEMILTQVEADFSTDDELIFVALGQMQKMYETETSRSYNACKIALDNFSKVLSTEVPTFGRDGSAPALLRIMEKYDAVRVSFKGVYKDLIEEQTTTVRGAQRLAYDS